MSKLPTLLIVVALLIIAVLSHSASVGAMTQLGGRDGPAPMAAIAGVLAICVIEERLLRHAIGLFSGPSSSDDK